MAETKSLGDSLQALAGIPSGPMRLRAAARTLGALPSDEGAQLIELALRWLRRSRMPKPGETGELGAAAALVQAILPEWGLDYERRSELYSAATQQKLLAATLFLTPAAHREAPPPRSGIEATLSLGHRKTLARTATAESFSKLGADKDARVARELLQNPRLTEQEVLRLASLRPAQPEVLLAISQSARFSNRLAVRTALARNPYSPAPLAFQLLPHLPNTLLAEIGDDGTLHPQVRQFARALVVVGSEPPETPQRLHLVSASATNGPMDDPTKERKAKPKAQATPQAQADAPSTGRSEQEILDARLHKLEGLRALGVNPFATSPKVTPIGEVVKEFGGLDAAQLEARSTDSQVIVAGRILAERSFGKAGFLKLRDRTGEIQAYVKRDVLGEALYAIVKLAEVGDIVSVVGTVFRSKTNELTIQAKEFRVLTKALRPLPEKWHGLTNLETRYRQRYLDLIANDEVRALFLRRSRIVKEIRAFLDARDFVEVETPMMHQLITGAAARPFETHHNALDADLYLRIAPELHLKRLVVGGLERVYEINRNFRNEGLSPQHNPEFTMLEFYWAYATYEDLMELTEQLFAHLAQQVLGTLEVPYQGQVLNFAAPFRRLPMLEGVREAFPAVRASEWTDAAALRKHLLADPAAHEFTAVERQALETQSAGELIARMFETRVEKSLIQPTFVTQFPTAISPLARKNDQNPDFVDRFELYAAGREIANAFNELNDPIDQRARFAEQVRKKAAGDGETMDYDEDYVRALEQGLPPTAGEGIGIDRLVMLLTDASNIRDVILFPLLKQI